MKAGNDGEGRPTAVESEALRDWHRLFGLLLTDFFTGSPREARNAPLQLFSASPAAPTGGGRA